MWRLLRKDASKGGILPRSFLFVIEPSKTCFSSPENTARSIQFLYYTIENPSLFISNPQPQLQKQLSRHLWENRDSFFSYDQMSLCITLYRGSSRPGAQPFSRPLLFLPKGQVFTMPQPCHFPWGLPGALPFELTVGMECGSVVEFLPNIQRPR